MPAVFGVAKSALREIPFSTILFQMRTSKNNHRVTDKATLTFEPRTGIRIRWYWIVSLIALGLAMVALNIDHWVARSFSQSNLPGDVRRIVNLSEFFAHGFGVLIVLIGIWQLMPESRRKVFRIACCALIPGLLVNLLKIQFGRIRPGFYENQFPGSIAESWIGWLPFVGRPENGISGYTIQSFPSGHTATVVGLAIGMSWLLPRGRGLFLFLAILATLQRISSQAHWTSDTLVSVSIAVLVAGVMTSKHNKLSKWFARFENNKDVSGEREQPEELKKISA